MAETIYVRGNRDDVRRVVAMIPRLLAGTAGGYDDLVRGYKLRMGNAILGKIKKAYEAKADGRADEAGETWPDLTKKYKAYGRRFGVLNSKGGIWQYGDGPRINEKKTLRAAAGVANGQKFRYAPGGKQGLLSKAQLDQWNKIFARTLGYLIRHGVPIGEAKSIAAGKAWNELKAMGAKTKLDVYGNRKVQILRDTGVIFNSLSPGIEDRPSSAPHQIMDAAKAGVLIVGTNAPHAGHHHNAKNPKRRRRLWPEPNKWPESWWNEFRQVGKNGLARMTVLMLQRGAA